MMKKMILQPTGKNTKDDFIKHGWDSWAVQEKYKDIWKDSIGDTILFVKNNYIFLVAKINDIKREDNKEYPFRFYFEEIEYVDIPLGRFNEIIGYSKKFIPRNYMLVKDENIKEAFAFLDTYIKVYDETKDIMYQEEIQKLDIVIYKEIEDKPVKKGELVKKNGIYYHPRDISLIMYSLKKANFTCALDKDHTTFKSKTTGKNYVEAHHLIPLNHHGDFDYSLDVPANIISLCPNCHKMVHLGNDNDVYKALELLYTKQKTRLDKVGLTITLDELKNLYMY